MSAVESKVDDLEIMILFNMHNLVSGSLLRKREGFGFVVRSRSDRGFSGSKSKNFK